MKIPDRETGRRITWRADGLLSHGGRVLPAGLMVALREYKSVLLSQSAGERWARPGYPARCGRLADVIGLEITGGQWVPGARMPSDDLLAARYSEKPGTVASALHILAVRGLLALEYHAYYVMPRDIWDRT